MSIDGEPWNAGWAKPVVLLTTLLWLTGLLGCLNLIFPDGLAGFEGQRAATPPQPSVSGTLWLAAVLVGGPVLLAILARIGRLPKTAIAYVVLAVLMAPPAVVLINSTSPTRHPAVIPTSTHCQEHSGGEASCPGG